MRVFLGIDLPGELKQKIAALTASYGLNKLPIKLVQRENFHIALKFLGDLTSGQIAEIRRLASTLANNQLPFKTKIKDAAVFPDFYNPRVLVLQVIGPELIAFGEKIIKQLDVLPFTGPENRRYVPHVTLGRIKGNVTDSEKQMIRGIKFESWLAIGSIQLFASQLTERGPLYTIIGEFELNG